MVEPSSSFEEDQIDMFELIRKLLRAWKTILISIIICTGLAFFYAWNAPEVFKAETLLVPTQEEKSATPSALSQFGGLAAMAGITIPSNSNVERVLATLETREFLKSFIIKKELLPIIYNKFRSESLNFWISDEKKDGFLIDNGIESLQIAIEVIKDKSGLIRLSVSWNDPRIAAEWTNQLVEQVNEKLREQAIADSRKRIGYLEQELAKTTLQDMRAVLYNLLETEQQKAMLANVNEDFALEVIDPAVASPIRVKPKRILIVALGGLCGAFLGLFFIFFRHFIESFKSSKKKYHE